jgi:DNA processing protein
MVLDPASREDLLGWLRVTLVPGVSDRSRRALLSAFGSPAAVMGAPAASLAQVAGESVAVAMATGAKPEWVERALAWVQEPGHHLITLADAAYPRTLLEIADPPSVIYARGRTELLNVPAIAIVGSRNATAQGKRDARAIAHALSEAGLAVVSGLALGIDASAHRGGLDGAGSSVAVMGTGADRLYPSGNAALARELAERGVVISEFPLGTAPLPDHFPRRNRLISGLARAVLVVEAAPQSGSLSTARWALEQGRDVFAIPGSIHSPLAKGCHWLIKQGAKLVECAEDVLCELGMVASTPAPSIIGAAHEGDLVLDALGHAPASIDELAERTGQGASQVAARLVELEIEGRVASLAGGRFQQLAAL